MSKSSKSIWNYEQKVRPTIECVKEKRNRKSKKIWTIIKKKEKKIKIKEKDVVKKLELYIIHLFRK